MSLEEAFQGFSAMMAEVEGGVESVRLDCALCQEPGEMVDGLFVHKFTGQPKCTYRSWL